jgi:toxin ParE1/3/4
MKCRKVILEIAKIEINENVLWYNSKRKGLGKEFSFEIRKTLNYIADFPLAFPVKYDEIRVAVVAVFPYTVHYYYDHINNTVFVSCVFHDFNDPEIPLHRDLF